MNDSKKREIIRNIQRKARLLAGHHNRHDPSPQVADLLQTVGLADPLGVHQ